MLCRGPEDSLFDTLTDCGVGCIAFSPLAQGVLSDKYLAGIPANSRAAKPEGFLQSESITPGLIEKVSMLNDMAISRGQSLAQMALAWVLRRKEVTSALIGASSPEQIKENIDALKNKEFTDEELREIDNILKGTSL